MAIKLTPGQGIIFMKVGTHAQEPLEDIIARKRREIEAAGVAFWGYGGNTCHPLTMVQPFVRQKTEEGQTIYLCMHEMDSKHFAVQERAKQYSPDGQRWIDVPQGINVLGSRYALVIGSLEQQELLLPLDQTKVGVGRARGMPGSRYISGRVDKACLEVVADKEQRGEAPKTIDIGLIARLDEPYAVFVK